MSIDCERLDVLSHKLPDGKTSQEMQAFNQVRIESQEFSGEADEASYDENKELVILVGKRGNLARLDRELTPGARRDSFRAEKIIYNRLTGAYDLIGARSGNVRP
jgi:lipopolysaccharide export system protein LptA